MSSPIRPAGARRVSASGRSFKRTIVGRRMPMGSLEDELLPRWIALPIFASDPLSSVAYATEAAMFTKEFPRLRKRLAKTGGLWVAYPKKASKVEG